jgi:AraC-like DNA-binding protein
MPYRKKGTPDFESIVNDPSQSFKWHVHDYPCPIAKWNHHPEYEVHLITTSRGRQFVGDYIGEFGPGNLVVTGSDLPHNWVSDRQPGEIIAGRDMVVQFPPDLLRRGAAIFPELAETETFLTTALRGIEYSGATARRGADLMGRIGSEQGFARLTSFFELIHLLASSVEYKVLATAGYSPLLDKDALQIVHDVLSYIIDNSSGTVRMARAAEIAGMSQSAFSRFFKRNTGNNFIDYVRKIRIGRACKLLSENEVSVTNACFEVGYANISNFNRQFRKERGITPSQYKKLSEHRVLAPLAGGAEHEAGAQAREHTAAV